MTHPAPAHRSGAEAGYLPEIDVLRLGFAVVVAAFHAGRLRAFAGTGAFAHGYLAIEFFLLVSGFFMARSIDSGRTPGTLRFLLRKTAPLYAVVAVSTLIRMAVNGFPSPTTWVWDFLLVREAGLSLGPPQNGVTWYISSMLVAMAALHPLFRRTKKDLLPSLALLVALVCYAALWHGCGGIVAGGRWAGLCTYRTVRAAAGISLGVLLHEAATAARARFSATPAGRHAFRALAFALLCSAVALTWGEPIRSAARELDYLCIPVVFALLFLVLSGWGSFLRSMPPRTRWCSAASLYLYLNHPAAIETVRQRWPGMGPAETLAALVALTLLACALCALGVRMLRAAGRSLFGLVLRPCVPSGGETPPSRDQCTL